MKDPAPKSSPAPAPTPRPSVTENVVAETMRRVHDELRHGAAPSFEAMLALGELA